MSGNRINWQAWQQEEDGSRSAHVGIVTPDKPELELEMIEQLQAEGVVDYATVGGMKCLSGQMSDEDRKWFTAHPQRRLRVRPEHLADWITNETTQGLQVRSNLLPRNDEIRFWLHPDEQGKFAIGDYVHALHPVRPRGLTAVLKIYIGVRQRIMLDPQDKPQQDTDAAIWRAVKRTTKRHGLWASVQATIRDLTEAGKDQAI